MTRVYKSGRKHSDADCFLRAPVDFAPSCTDNDDGDVFIGAVNDEHMANLQRNDQKLRALMDHREGQGSAVPRVFA